MQAPADPHGTQELIVLLEALSGQLVQLASFAAGLATGIAFVVASKMRWFR